MSKLIAPTHFWLGKWWQAREQAGFPNGNLLSNGTSPSRKPAGAEVKLGKRSANTNPTPRSLCQRSVCTTVQQHFLFSLPQQAKTIWKIPALSEWGWPGDWGRLLGRGYSEVLFLLWSSPLKPSCVTYWKPLAKKACYLGYLTEQDPHLSFSAMQAVVGENLFGMWPSSTRHVQRK